MKLHINSEPSSQQIETTYKSGNIRNYLLLILFLILINLMTFEQSLVPTNVVPIQVYFGIGPALLGAIVAGYTIVLAVTMIIFGYFADKTERINLIILGGCVWAICVVLSFYSQTVRQFAVTRIIAGVGIGSLTPVGFSMLCDIVSTGNRSKAFAVWTIVTFLGAIAGIIIGGDIYSQFERTGINFLWKDPFLFVGAIGFFMIAVLVLFPEPKRAAAEDLMKDILSKEGLVYSYRIKRVDLKKIYTRKSNFWLIINFVDTIYPGLLLLWIFSYLSASFNLAEGIMSSELLITLGIVALGFLVGTIIFSWLGDRQFKKGDLSARAKIAVYCAFLNIPFIAAGFIVPLSPYNFLWIALLLAIGLGIDQGIGPNWYSTLIDVNVPENRGTMIATASFLDNIGRAIGQWAGGLLLAFYMTTQPAQPEFYALRAATWFLVLQIPFWIPVLKYVKGDIQEVNAILAARAKEMKNPAEFQSINSPKSK
ncbi:MAG: MFS transporter [Candidatus Helarchaeota archaeon]|nr:MFS transporter [Candidatus Helarchaeota archaeon]